MSDLFNVVLTGELLKGQSIMQAANSLSKLFKIAPLQAQQMLARAPLVIKKNLEEDTAIRFVQAMYKSGFGASVEQQRAVRTAILLHSMAAQYDDDEEGAAVTRITPVLVEQTLLDESLDTELTIPPAQTVQAQIHHAVSEPPKAQLFEQNFDDSVAQAPTELPSQGDFAVETDANATIADEPIVESEQTQVIDDLAVGSEKTTEAVFAAQAAEFEAELGQDDLVDQIAATTANASPLDLFAPWDETCQIKTTQVDVDNNEVSAEIAAPDDVFTSLVNEEQDCGNKFSEQAFESDELVFTQAAELERVELSAQLAALPDVEEVTAGLPEPVEASKLLELEVPAEDTVEEIFLSDMLQDQQIDSAQEIQNALDEEIDSAKDLEALQWVEPVAQWQTVAELAEDLAQESPSAERLGTATAVSETISESVADVAGTGNGFEATPFNTYQEFEGDSFTAAEGHENPEQWNAPVDVSPALTAKLAEIAELSKVAEDKSVAAAQVNDDASEETENLNGGVLLFEASDLSQIVSADWDDWHSSDEGIELTAASVDPLLDFDLVEADWRNRSVNLSFSSSENLPETHFDVFDEKVAMQEELEAFLESDEYDERPGYELSAPVSVATLGADVDNETAEHFEDDGVEASEEQAAKAAEIFEIEDRHLSSSIDSIESFAHSDLSAVDNNQQPTDSTTEVGDVSDWSYEISVQASCGFLEVTIPQGRELNIVSAASVTMGLSLHEQLQAGNGVRAWLLAKGFLLNTYEALNSAGSVGVTAVTHGMVCAIDMEEFPVMVQHSAYLASTDDVRLNADQSRLNPVVSACKWIHCSGAGTLWLNAQGLWEMVEVDGSFTMNSRYVMAYTQSLTLHAPPLAGLKSYLTSGGGVECRFKGRGVVWVQTDAAKAPVIWQKTA